VWSVQPKNVLPTKVPSASQCLLLLAACSINNSNHIQMYYCEPDMLQPENILLKKTSGGAWDMVAKITGEA